LTQRSAHLASTRDRADWSANGCAQKFLAPREILTERNLITLRISNISPASASEAAEKF